MKKGLLILVVLVLVAAGWFGKGYVVQLGRQVGLIEHDSEPYRAFRDYLTALVESNAEKARRLAGNESVAQRTDRLVRGLREWIGDVFRGSFSLEGETISPDGNRAGVTVTHHFRIDPVGTHSTFGSMLCEARNKANLVKTADGWRVVAFEHSYSMFSCKEAR